MFFTLMAAAMSFAASANISRHAAVFFFCRAAAAAIRYAVFASVADDVSAAAAITLLLPS